jgi:hypothetical protein
MKLGLGRLAAARVGYLGAFTEPRKRLQYSENLAALKGPGSCLKKQLACHLDRSHVQGGIDPATNPTT